jgi:HK97 gp10 family phage protein
MIRGLRKSKETLRIQGKDLELKVKKEIERAGRLTERDAKRDAPKDNNDLYKSILYEQTRGGLGARVSANVFYAAYQEFGTGGKVNIPAGFEKIAGEFKGKTGRQVDMKPQPYLIPNAKKNYEKMVDKIRKIK